jgi:twitching motility protein PilT
VLRQPRIDELASKLIQKEGSDLHLKVWAPPAVRVHGLLEYLEGYEVLRPVDTEDLARDIMSEKRLEEFEEHGEVDFSYTVGGVGRFRINAFRQRGLVSIVMRFIPFEGPKFEDLGLPKIVGMLAREERGIILVTGTTGSGKPNSMLAFLRAALIFKTPGPSRDRERLRDRPHPSLSCQTRIGVPRTPHDGRPLPRRRRPV